MNDIYTVCLLRMFSYVETMLSVCYNLFQASSPAATAFPQLDWRSSWTFSEAKWTSKSLQGEEDQLATVVQPFSLFHISGMNNISGACMHISAAPHYFIFFYPVSALRDFRGCQSNKQVWSGWVQAPNQGKILLCIQWGIPALVPRLQQEKLKLALGRWLSQTSGISMQKAHVKPIRKLRLGIYHKSMAHSVVAFKMLEIRR